MNSFLKQESSKEIPNHESFVMSFENKMSAMQNISEIELIYKKLKYLGLNLDPFSSEVPTECQQIMDSLGLSLHMKNPYLATNILLRLLDKAEEQLNKLKH